MTPLRNVWSIRVWSVESRDCLTMIPLDPTQRSVLVNFKAPESFVDEMSEAAETLSMPKSALIREAVREFLDSREDRLSA